MNKILIEASKVLNNSEIQSWKAKDNKVIGYTCSYVPAEIIYSTGILPVRLRGLEALSTDIGDTYFGPYICSFPKCILQLAGEGKYNFLDGVIITPGCDSIRRLDECWRKAGEDFNGILPDFFFHYGVPHKFTDFSLKWFIDETHRFIENLEKHFHVSVDKERLRETIKLYNKGRKLLLKLEEFRSGKEIYISGTDTFIATLAGDSISREKYNSMLEELIGEIESKKVDISADNKRIMLVGSANDDVELIKLIEKSGSIIVADNICFGPRHEYDPVDEDGDPIESIARRYLSYSACPRMVGDYKKRLNILKEKTLSAKVDGVILQNIRFCDLHGSENGIFERDLEAIGIPCMRLEREYGQLVETGRIRMRVDAFLERISKSPQKA